MKKQAALLVALLVVAGAALRIAGSFDPLWLDETWSLLLLRDVQNIPDIFTRIHLDNNHYLNSVYMFLLGPYRTPFLYRIPALIAGILLTVLVPLRFLKKKQPIEAVMMAILLCFSFLLIDQSGEARGYMPMFLFGYWSFTCLERYCSSKNPLHALLFGIAASLALCWHIAFLEWYAFLIPYSLYLLWETNKPAQVLKQMLWLHVLPLLSLAVLIVVDLRFLQIGFAVPNYLWVKMLQTAVSIFGLSFYSIPALILCGLMIVCCFLFLMHRHFRTASTQNQMIVTVGILTAIVILLFGQTGALPRHFLPLVFLFLMFLGQTLAMLWKGSQSRRMFAGCIISLYVIGNGTQTAFLLRYGRGDALPALQYIAANDTGNPVRVFAIRPVLVTNLTGYYWPLTESQADLKVENAEEALSKPPAWFLAPDDPYRRVPKYDAFLFGGKQYERVNEAFQDRSYWTVYRRLDVE